LGAQLRPWDVLPLDQRRVVGILGVLEIRGLRLKIWEDLGVGTAGGAAVLTKVYKGIFQGSPTQPLKISIPNTPLCTFAPSVVNCLIKFHHRGRRGEFFRIRAAMLPYRPSGHGRSTYLERAVVLERPPAFQFQAAAPSSSREVGEGLCGGTLLL
jgi:hypothetical protein